MEDTYLTHHYEPFTRNLIVQVNGTAYGEVIRKVTPRGERYYASVNGQRVLVNDPHGAATIGVLSLPRDIDSLGY
tara:strand:- start:5441 stop:5665 length:225 start_codon:yes stop_codon:yes gene_type:complete